jgi:hypothetical protein
VAEFAEGLGFDRADAFVGDLEELAYHFEGVLGAVSEAKAHLRRMDFEPRSNAHSCDEAA